MEYIHIFETRSEYDEERTRNYKEPWLSLTTSNDKVDYNKETMAKTPFTIDILTDGTLSWKVGDQTVYYDLNGSSTTGRITSATTLTVHAGDELACTSLWFEMGTPPSTTPKNIVSTAKFSVRGNIFSLMYSDYSTVNSFKGGLNIDKYAITNIYRTVIYGLFSGCTTLVSAKNLLLPSADLIENCYANMFYGCTNLEDAPELPAQKLVANCYKQMFYGCSKLNRIKCLATDRSASGCVQNWTSGVSTSGTFIKDASANWGTAGPSSIPLHWTVEDAVE